MEQVGGLHPRATRRPTCAFQTPGRMKPKQEKTPAVSERCATFSRHATATDGRRKPHRPSAHQTLTARTARQTYGRCPNSPLLEGVTRQARLWPTDQRHDRTGGEAQVTTRSTDGGTKGGDGQAETKKTFLARHHREGRHSFSCDQQQARPSTNIHQCKGWIQKHILV